MIGPPERFANVSEQDFRARFEQSGIESAAFYSFQVLHRGSYEEQKRRDERIIEKLDKMPETILTEVDRRIAQATQDPNFITQVAKAQVEYLEERERKRAEEQKRFGGKNPLAR